MNRRFFDWGSINTARSGPPLNSITPLTACSSLVILLSRFARFCCCPSFLSMLSGWRAGCILLMCGCSTDKENDHDANSRVRDCLAESKTNSTSATLRADQPRLRNGSLSTPGTCFHRCRSVLGHSGELRISLRRSSGLVLPRPFVRKKQQRKTESCAELSQLRSMKPLLSWSRQQGIRPRP